MENSGKHCYRCAHFTAYYVKGDKRFNRIKLGRCCAKREIVGLHDACEEYKPKKPRRKIPFSTHAYLDHLLCEITALREVIEEQSNEAEQSEEM